MKNSLYILTEWLLVKNTLSLYHSEKSLNFLEKDREKCEKKHKD